jgi:hypothetical protein
MWVPNSSDARRGLRQDAGKAVRHTEQSMDVRSQPQSSCSVTAVGLKSPEQSHPLVVSTLLASAQSGGLVGGGQRPAAWVGKVAAIIGIWILCAVALQRPNVLFCMSSRTNCMLLVLGLRLGLSLDTSLMLSCWTLQP